MKLRNAEGIPCHGCTNHQLQHMKSVTPKAAPLITQNINLKQLFISNTYMS